MYVNHSNAGVLASRQLKELDAAFEASKPAEVEFTPPDRKEVLEGRLRLRDAHVRCLSRIERLPADLQATLKPRLARIDRSYQQTCRALNLSWSGVTTPPMLDRQVRSPEQYESAARRIDAGMNAARCLASILDEVEELRDPWLESHLKGYEAEIGKISELAITAGVQGAPDQLADLIGHLDQCALPVLLAQSSGQDVEYREAFGRFERQLCASARNSERA